MHFSPAKRFARRDAGNTLVLTATRSRKLFVPTRPYRLRRCFRTHYVGLTAGLHGGFLGGLKFLCVQVAPPR
eukprot:6177528-Pleurochrysis_carterae.AAC.2